MKTQLEEQINKLFLKIDKIIDSVEMSKSIASKLKYEVDLQEDIKKEFFNIVNKVSLKLTEEQDNFYGYFLFQMSREISFSIAYPTGVKFKDAKYTIYFNPYMFLQLDINQMKDSIKHEIHHILSLHLIRIKDLRSKYNLLSLNLAMDIVVNQYLEYLPPYAVTLNYVNNKYSLNMKPFNTLEYYAKNINDELSLFEENKHGEIIDENDVNEFIENNLYEEARIESFHDIWFESDDIDQKTLTEFTKKYVSNAKKGYVPVYIDNMISDLDKSQDEIPWNLYLKKIVGTLINDKRKTITRKNRRQPDRLDLRGRISNYKPKIVIALDISGSISNEEFIQAVKEVLNIVRNYNNEITIVECDNEIKREYKVRSIKDVKDRISCRGGTRFNPVFEYANNKKVDLLIYFTDGKGEKELSVVPKGYHVLWVISGRGESLSLVKSFGKIKKLKKLDIIDDNIELKDIKTDGYSMNNQEPLL